jgi:uncharacterized membrane protein YraQ (UPF0718 family)
LLRGLDPAASLTFMLATPIVNPLVLVSTWVAYGGGRHGFDVAAARAVVGLVTAVTVGLTIGRHTTLRPTAPGAGEGTIMTTPARDTAHGSTRSAPI